MEPRTRLAFVALAAAEKATVVLESPAQVAARYMKEMGYDDRLATHLAFESPQLRAITVLGHAWRCLEGRMDLRRFCGYLKLMWRIGGNTEGYDAALLAQRSVELALFYTAWERSRQSAAPAIPAAVLLGISEKSAEEAISLAQRCASAEPFAEIRNVASVSRAAFGLPPLGPEPPPLDFDPATETQGDYGDRYLDPEMAEALALEKYFVAAGIVPADDEVTWGRVMEDHKLSRPIHGTVVGVVANGLEVSIYDPPVRAFFPFSQIVSRPRDIKRIKNPERWIAKRDRFKILRYDRRVGYIAIATWDEPYGWRPLAATRPR
jgi:hypothetical protein